MKRKTAVGSLFAAKILEATLLDPEVVRTEFQRQYASAAPRLFVAPGRVNLIGEHTDYNEGFVFPIAIERETIVAAAARDDRHVEVRSLAHPNDVQTFDLDAPGPKVRGHWLDYVEGVAQSLEGRGIRLRGANLVIDSDVPGGAGLSSSAALEVSIGLALLGVSGQTLEPKELALTAQAAEHAYVGTRCGIMDQYIAALGKKDHALLIDCRSLEPELVPFDLSHARLIVCDTRVKHELASSEYNTRRAECERGAELLRGILGRSDVRSLRDVSVKEIEQHAHQLPEPIRRRCRHVVTENARTLLARDALRKGDLSRMGALMLESHRSLRDDYEVSAPELDLVVDTAKALPGVFGARMTGGGFGGCAILLVVAEQVEHVSAEVARGLRERHNREPYIFLTRACAGARELPLTS